MQKCRAAVCYETPIADFLLNNAVNLNANFHALPIYHLDPQSDSWKIYDKVYGQKYLKMETTITGKAFDSFFFPMKAIKKSQSLAAEAFGAKDTLFVTCGTTISNYIAVNALVTPKSKVLLDREAHQSLHFAIKNEGVFHDYFYREPSHKQIDLKKLIQQIKTAKDNHSPYDIVIISAAGYDGVVCNVYEIIREIVDIHPETQFIVDEAWSSAFYFHPKLSPFTAGFAAKQLKNVNIVATQSAHKSLLAMRQASLIHSFASDEITQKLYKSRFKYHSTSPNYPILASIDIARAVMQKQGQQLLEKALQLSDQLCASLASDPILKNYQLINMPSSSLHLLLKRDPLKIVLNIKKLGLSGSQIQEYLYFTHGIYFSRFTDETILFNIHIGINETHIHQLISALKSMVMEINQKEITAIDKNDFVIPYPPGIPLYAPGEQMHPGIHAQIRKNVKNGLQVFQVS